VLNSNTTTVLLLHGAMLDRRSLLNLAPLLPENFLLSLFGWWVIPSVLWWRFVWPISCFPTPNRRP